MSAIYLILVGLAAFVAYRETHSTVAGLAVLGVGILSLITV